MNILILKTYAEYVDVLNSTYNLQELGLAKAFNKKGHKCDIVYFGGKRSKQIKIKYDNNNDFTVFYIKAINFLKNGIYSKELLELIKEYDIVHSGEYDQLQSWILAKKIPEKLVIYNGNYYSDFNKKYNIKCKVFDTFFLPRYKKYNIEFDTKSNLSKEFLKSRGLKNVTSIGVGIDLEQLQAKKMIDSDLSIKINQEKEKGIKIITYIGKIEKRRNIEFLVDVFNSICKVRNDIKLLIIGKGNDIYKKRCFDKFENLKEKVIYKESISQGLLPKIYNLSDIFLLPTRYEIFGMVLLEAMYFGAPVITTFNGGSNMLIENNKSGIVLKDFNVEIWKKEIFNLLNNNKFHYNIVYNAKKKIEKEYTWDVLTDKFLKVFKKKLNE